MRRLLLGAALSVLAAPAALACAGGDCDSEPAPLIAELKGGKTCYGIFGFGVPFLNPYNDTRVNLALLLEDRKLLSLADKPPPSVPPNYSPSAPQNGSPAPPLYPVPFWLKSYRDLKDEWSGTPPPPPERDALLARAAALGIDGALVDEALTRLAATQTGRCAAETPATVLGFVAAAADAPALAPAERTVLAGERLRIAGLCLKIAEPPQPLETSSAAGQGFAAYLAAARHFYRDELDAAESGFAALATRPQGWVAEAAAYMVGRVHLNQGQLNAFKEYGDFDPAAVDKAKLDLARGDLRHYLDTYPQGRYAASARGLFRRIDWLAGDAPAIVDGFAAAFAAYAQQKPERERVFELLDEIDRKYLQEPAISPLLGGDIPWQVPELATTVVLTRMRDTKGDGDKRLYQPVADDILAQQKAASGTSPELVALVDLANAYFVERDAAKVVQATEGHLPAPGMSNVAFSTIVLRGLALESTQRWQDGNALWRGLLSQETDPLRSALAQLALALNDERLGKTAEIFAPGSPVSDPALHRALLKHAAPPALERAVIERAESPPADKATALFTLLYKDLLHGDYRGFGEVIARFPPERYEDVDGLHLFGWQGQSAPNYACPALADSVRRLVAAPDDAKALNCVGEFFYRFEERLVPGQKPPEDELGGTPDGFAGKTRTRLDYYLAVMNDPKSRGDAEAYALYRAVNCFASSGINHCGDQDIPKADRKRWFDRLKQSYKDNVWGKQQKYWW